MFKFISIAVTILNQSGAIRLVKNDEYALLNKETNKDINFPIDVLRETLEDRDQPKGGKYQHTQRRLRRSLTPEEKDKLMT